MLRKDYIMRLIEQFVSVLARIVGLKKDGNLDEALEMIKKSGQQYFGLSPQLLESGSDIFLIDLLKTGAEFDPNKCVLLARLLQEHAEVNERLGAVDRSLNSYIKALSLFLEALLSPKDIVIEGAIERIGYLLRKLEGLDIPLHIQLKLFRYLELSGDYAQAENVLWLIIESTDDEYLEEGIAFYERLLNKSDQELRRGNLPRAEVMEGLRGIKEM